ncbi:hypothetical protein B0H67DRAFT_500654 [Lasiosphaeris hirsuta]|uniref:FAD-binding domain-containing protein n=1 Tax=Lasiosphaeris hirsuta TaxID=260670 RepID=A0AA39ZPW0_9PEZI|nr:hypothetical protein B0H67DRAFT_500654 [Lasiosphaeris hirsuta]
MKIIIVGAGFSGTCTYLLLRKLLPPSPSPHIVVIYDAHDPREAGASPGAPDLLMPQLGADLQDSAPIVGNIISLSPVAMRLLKYVDTKLYDKFKARSYVNRHFTFMSARGHTLGLVPAGDDKLPVEYTVSCPRYDSWRWLHETVGYDTIQYRRVTDVDLTGEKPIVRFDDGGEDDADLVVGADGVRSVVKRALFAEEANKYDPVFEGFCGVGGFMNVDIPLSVTKDESMVLTFGPAGSFGYCSAAPLAQGKISWWSNWGSPTPPDGNIMDPREIRKQLQARHGTWKDPFIQSVIAQSTTDRIYSVWTTPDLPRWGEKGAVLLGDAAHTLQATSGSGANQALEDSVTFCLLLSHYLGNGEPADSELTARGVTDLAIKGLYQIRSPRVASIRNRMRRLYITSSRIESTLVEYLWYLLLYLWTNSPFISRCYTPNSR